MNICSLLQAGEVRMVDFASIPHCVRIDMRPEAVAQRIDPRALAMLDNPTTPTVPKDAPSAAPPAAAAAAAPAGAAVPAATPAAAAAPAPPGGAQQAQRARSVTFAEKEDLAPPVPELRAQREEPVIRPSM